jgi:hypothetical protein
VVKEDVTFSKYILEIRKNEKKQKASFDVCQALSGENKLDSMPRSFERAREIEEIELA